MESDFGTRTKRSNRMTHQGTQSISRESISPRNAPLSIGNIQSASAPPSMSPVLFSITSDGSEKASDEQGRKLDCCHFTSSTPTSALSTNISIDDRQTSNKLSKYSPKNHSCGQPIISNNAQFVPLNHNMTPPHPACASIFSELVCPICLEYFDMPVTMNCGHTFCRYCITHGRLIGGTCPLCREELEGDYSINRVISNLLHKLNLSPSSNPSPSKDGSKSLFDWRWWNATLPKPNVPLPLFLRIFFGESHTSPLLLDDAITAIRQAFNARNAWSVCEWIFSLEDIQTLAETAKLDQDTIEGKREQLVQWVASYIRSSGDSVARKFKKHDYIFEICMDRAHQVEGLVINTHEFKNDLPWDIGRHGRSQISLSHTSVSSCHLLIVPMDDGIGIVECGSTIGTMVKITGNYSLKDGATIHLGDRVEVETSFDYIDYDILAPLVYLWHKSTGMPILVEDGIIAGTSSRISIDDVDDDINSMNKKYCRIKPLCFVKIKNANNETITVPADPRGTIFGRGPYTQHQLTKIGVTTANGYVSRDHCALFYANPKNMPPGWYLKDMSMLGTYIKLPPYESPHKIKHGTIIKVGQCRTIIKNPNHTDTTPQTQDDSTAHQPFMTNRASNLPLDLRLPHISMHCSSYSSISNQDPVQTPTGSQVTLANSIIRNYLQ